MNTPVNRKPILLDFEKPLAELEERISQIQELADENDVDVSEQIHQLEARAVQLRQEIFHSLSPSQRIQVARHPRRPSTMDYIQAISDEWLELHGDRRGWGAIKLRWKRWTKLGKFQLNMDLDHCWCRQFQ